MARAIGTILILIVSLVLVQGRSIFEEPEGSHFIRLGSRLEEDNRHRRDLNNDLGSQNVYYVSRTPSVWGSAWLTCRQAMNGQLLTVETEAEDQFVRDLLIENHIASVWTSGAYDAELGIWRWVSTGGEVSYVNWLANQPAASDSAARIAIQNSLFSNGWTTVGEDTTGHYICEVRSAPVEQPTPSTEPPATEAPTEPPTPEPTPEAPPTPEPITEPPPTPEPTTEPPPVL